MGDNLDKTEELIQYFKYNLEIDSSIGALSDEDMRNCVKALEIMQSIPMLIKQLENKKDPNPQNLYGREKNKHYDNAIRMLEKLLL